jgi:hypothetical protein
MYMITGITLVNFNPRIYTKKSVYYIHADINGLILFNYPFMLHKYGFNICPLFNNKFKPDNYMSLPCNLYIRSATFTDWTNRTTFLPRYN